MKSRPYQTTGVKDVCVKQVIEGRAHERCDVGLDVSKQEYRVVVRWASGAFERPWRVELAELPVFLEKLRELGEDREVVIAMEPTGSYGDPVRQALHDAGWKVYRVSPKASHDYAEVFDGVPSQHDGKDAACVAELSALNKSAQWRWDSSWRELRNETDWMDAQQQSLTRWLARLEALLARFWPEACELLELSSATLLKLLEHYGSVAALAADPEARVRLRRWGGSKLKGEKIEELLASAAKTMGVRALPTDVSQMQRYAQAALLARREVRLSKLQLLKLTKENEVIERQGMVVGHVTAAVLWAHLGDPRDYHCAEAYRKAMGLNLKERSSGRWQGHLKISKRGPGQVRRWLYFAALRCCQEPWIEGWYETKKNQGEGHAKRALVALMRKLALALYYVGAKASPYDIRTLLPEADRYKAKKKHVERMKR